MQEMAVTLNDGYKMPKIGLGTWKLSGEACVETVKTALGIGYRHIDTAAVYGNEAVVGEGVAGSGVDRQEIFVTTKIMPSVSDVGKAVRERLQLLGTDYLDLCLIHWPPNNSDGGYGQDLWRALEDEQERGVIRSIGVSNYEIELLERLLATARVPLAVNQIELSPFAPKRELVGYCQGKGIVVQAYSPLTQAEKLDNPVLREIAGKYKKTPAQVLLRWCLERQTVPLPKASSEAHLRENLDIFDFTLSADDLNTLESSV